MEKEEWKKITSLRNLLAHEYFGINLYIIWDIIQNKIPQLQQACKKIIDNNQGEL